ncbi:hypothetical protein BYT27DRAFT_7116760, partial [Phlegmacium glaucopus]
GLYSGIFVMYLQDHWVSRGGSNKTNNIVFYALCALYVLSVVTIVVDITVFIYSVSHNSIGNNNHPFFYAFSTVFGCCDFIAQSVLIYRCWIVWGCNIRVVIIPSILAFTFLGTTGSQYILSGEVVEADWGNWLGVASLAMSMTVNALVTGLIIFKIFKMYREVKSASDDQTLGATGGSKFRTVIFVLIESGMVLFSIQLVRLVCRHVHDCECSGDGLNQLQDLQCGLTPTIILVRVSMGLSFHDKESMIESSVGSLRFAADNPNSIPETGDIENRDDAIGIRLSDDIEMVER